MSGGLAISSLTEHYSGRITWFVVASCMVAAMGGAIFGYDIGVSGGVTSMEPFLKKFFPEVITKMKQDTEISNYCKFDSQVLTLFTSSLYFAGLFASLLASSTTKTFGRKLSILVGGVTVLAGSALGGAALNVYMLILGRILLGLGVGFANQVVPMYLVEIAPSKYRGAFNNGFHLSLSFGILLASLVNFGTEKIKGGWGWRVSITLTAFPALIITLGSFFLPETPNSLIERDNDHKKAELVLQRIRGTSDVQEELNDLIEASSVSKTTNHPLRDLLLHRKYRPQLVMSIAIPFFQQMTGINVVGFYAPVLFRTIGLGESASLLAAVVIGVVSMAADTVAIIAVDQCGRRCLFFWGGVQMIVSFIVVGIILAVKLGDHGTLSAVYAYVVLILLCSYSVGFSYSWGPVGWLVPSEIFQLEIRSAAQGITVGMTFIFTFLIAQTLLAMLCHFKAGIFFFFAGWIALMTGFVHLFLPETKNVPLEKIGLLWKEHWVWSRVVGEDEKL